MVTDRSSHLSRELQGYLLAHSSPPDEVLTDLAAETARRFPGPSGMQIGADQGALMTLLTRLTGVRSAVEVGTFTGYSAIAMAAGLSKDGSIISLEVDPHHAQVARGNIAEAGLESHISVIEGPALRSLEELQGPFDLVFIDADKVTYDAYYEAVLPKLARHGLIVVDNTLQGGGVLASEKDPHEGARALRAFNDKVVNDPRVVCVLTTIRDGVTLIRRAG